MYSISQSLHGEDSGSVENSRASGYGTGFSIGKDGCEVVFGLSEKFNGKTMLKPTVADVIAEVDSCLLGGGGVCHGK